MLYLKSFVFMSEKRDVQGRQRFLARFVSGPYNRLKNLSAAVNATRSATRILLRGRGLEPKPNFVAQKWSSLGPMLNKLMLLKRVTEGAWGQCPQPLRDFAA